VSSGGRSTADTFGPSGEEPTSEWHAHIAAVIARTELPGRLWEDVPDPARDPAFESAPNAWRPYLAGALDNTESFLRRFVVFPSPHEAVAAALWTAHTHVVDAAEVSPYLQVTSPEKRSGKTRLLDVLELLVRKPWRAVSPSEAVIYRKVEADQPTLLLDEVDTTFGTRASERTEGIRALLNAGNRRGTTVPRMVGEGRKMRVHDFPTFCPKVLAGIGQLPDTVADRSIAVSLQRRARNEPVERFRYRAAKAAAADVRAALMDALDTVAETLGGARPDIPDSLGDRAADSWEPLLAIADAAGGRWPGRARAAALARQCERPEDLDDASLSLLLLADSRAVFERLKAERIPTTTLIDELLVDDERPWREMGRSGKPLNAHGLGRLLRPYQVRPALMKFESVPGRGYRRVDLEPVWDRYLPALTAATDRYSVTSLTASNEAAVVGRPLGNGVTVGWLDGRAGKAASGSGDGEITTAHVDCADYRRHRSFHRQADSGWVCDTCKPRGEAS
jgi:hypothetical protein